MKFCLIHISLLLLFTGISQAQTDSTLSPVLLRLSNDLAFLSSEEIFSTEYTPVEYSSKGFDEKWDEQHSLIFDAVLAEAETDYQFLNHLPEVQKSALIFSFCQTKEIIQNELAEAGLPAELRFLAPALSGMNQRSVGSVKSAGLWQLTHFQAVLNGLTVNRLLDERFDFGRSTRAAVAELLKMKKVFGSDEKAILAFLAGPTNLRNALAELPENAGNDEILKLLPASVSETLALWQAMAVFFIENKPAEIPQTFVFDTIQIHQQIHFQQLEKVLGVPLADLQKLNPQYPYSIVPGEGSATYLYLPKGKEDEFALLQDSVYQLYDSTLFEMVAQKIEYPPAPSRQYVGEKVKDLEIEGKTKIKYTLKSGDVLGFIAEDYDVRVEDLKYWNNIYNERRIQAGQKLDIFVDDEDAEYYRNLHPEPLTKSGQKNPAAAASFPIPENARKIEHEVKSGESPYVIAKQYEGVTPEAILYWNGISDARKIQIGQKLTIYVSE